MKAAVVLGTRPEVIKLASVIRVLSDRPGCRCTVVHTNQHYDPNLDAVFFKQFSLPEPGFNLKAGVDILDPAAQAGRLELMIQRLEQVLPLIQPDFVVVQGDTDSALAGALAASKLSIPVAHVEAGLRCFDMNMPEEANRIRVDHLSTWLFPPAMQAVQNLQAEGLVDGVFQVGNTVVDALRSFAGDSLPANEETRFSSADSESQGYIVATIHRAGNTDSATRLRELLSALEEVASRSGLAVVFPVHPRTSERMVQFALKNLFAAGDKVRFVEPMGYREFVGLLRRAELVVTDSGGVQEEACILGVPAVTARTTTERPETVAVGANTLASSGEQIVQVALKILRKPRKSWPNPYGDGQAGLRIVDRLEFDIARRGQLRAESSV